MSTGGEAAADWLDDHCWACGSEDVDASAGDRVLCSPCRRRIYGPPQADDSARVVSLLYWQAHPLERCWRCLAKPVDREDELGLCNRCRREAEGSGSPRAGQPGPSRP